MSSKVIEISSIINNSGCTKIQAFRLKPDRFQGHFELTAPAPQPGLQSRSQTQRYWEAAPQMPLTQHARGESQLSSRFSDMVPELHKD